MNWETVTSGIGNKVYALWNDGRKLLTLGLQSTSNFVRIEANGEKRAFTIRHEGFLKNKVVMRNEYGVKIGYIANESKENLIALNDQKVYYSIQRDQEPKVIIYKETPDKPLAVCALQLDQEKGILPSVKSNATYQSLLLALCWYLFSTVTKQGTVPQYV